MDKTLSSYLESEGFLQNGINYLLEICYRDHLRSLLDGNDMPAESDPEQAELHRGIKIFSKREKEVLIWMAEGLSSKMIADKLNISEHTVINHRRSMQEKSNKPNATALVSFAIRNGII